MGASTRQPHDNRGKSPTHPQHCSRRMHPCLPGNLPESAAQDHPSNRKTSLRRWPCSWPSCRHKGSLPAALVNPATAAAGGAVAAAPAASTIVDPAAAAAAAAGRLTVGAGFHLPASLAHLPLPSAHTVGEGNIGISFCLCWCLAGACCFEHCRCCHLHTMGEGATLASATACVGG
eukprot:1161564-Pelagomonas_calceolata.AAC.16